MLSGVRARKKWEKWAEIIALSKLPASLPKHQTLLPLPWAACLLHGGTPASYLQGFLMLIRCNYSLLCTSISTLASFDSAVGKILPTGLSSLHEPEISDTYLNFLFAAAGTIPHVFRNRNKLNGIHVFPPPFESGVLNFIHVNLNLTDVLFSGLWTCFGSWVVLFFFLRLHFGGWQVDTRRSGMLPGLNPWLLLLWELPRADWEKRAALSSLNSKHLS